MVSWVIHGAEFELPRNLALLDTNVLVARAHEDDAHHLNALYFLDSQEDFVLGVAPPVIAEACSLLIGKLKRPDRAEWLLRWLLTPGTGIRLLPAPHAVAEVEAEAFLLSNVDWMAKRNLDYVDSFLMQMAHRLTVTCAFKPDLVIVTADLRDFVTCYNSGFAYRIHDLGSNQTF